MVRAPAKTCPNLSRLFHDAEPALLAAFLRSKVFAKLKWLETYRFEPEDAEGSSSAEAMLREQKKDRLGPLESEAVDFR